MLLLMIRLHMLLLALAELVKIQHMLQTHMAPLNGRSLLIIGHTHYTLITWKLLMVGGCWCFELPPMSKFLILRVWLRWCAKRTRGLYWFWQNVPMSSLLLLLVLLAPKVCSRGYKRTRE